MFLSQGVGHTWTFNPLTRGRLKGRLTHVTVGYFILEHMATGKLFIGHGKDCMLEVDTNLARAMEGNHPSVALVRLLQSDCEVKVHEYPCGTVKEAKRLTEALRDSVEPAYLLLN